jgi:hypothetical protein
MMTSEERLKRRRESNARSKARKRGEPVPAVPRGRPGPPPRCSQCGEIIGVWKDCGCP